MRLGGHIGEHEELAPAMRPAGHLGDRPRRTVGRIELVEPRISIGLEDPAVALQMTLRVVAAERAIVANIHPRPPSRRLAFDQYRHGGVVAMHPAAGKFHYCAPIRL